MKTLQLDGNQVLLYIQACHYVRAIVCLVGSLKSKFLNMWVNMKNWRHGSIFRKDRRSLYTQKNIWYIHVYCEIIYCPPMGFLPLGLGLYVATGLTGSPHCIQLSWIWCIFVEVYSWREYSLMFVRIQLETEWKAVTLISFYKSFSHFCCINDSYCRSYHTAWLLSRTEHWDRPGHMIFHRRAEHCTPYESQANG